MGQKPTLSDPFRAHVNWEWDHRESHRRTCSNPDSTCGAGAGSECSHLNTRAVLSPGVVIGERCAHGVDRNPGYEAREKEPGETNPDRKCARERLPRYDVPVTNREAGDEGEIDRVADRPALHKADQQTQGDLNRQNCRQHRPRKMNGVAEGHEKAPPHALWRPPVHAYSYVSVRFRYSRPSPNSKVAQKLLP